MFNLGNSALVNRLFRPVDDMVWDMTSGKIGFLGKDGIATIDLGTVVDGSADDAKVTINPITDFSMTLPAFAQSVQPNDINLGDLIFSGDKPLGWVVGKKVTDEGKTVRFELLKKDGTSGRWTPPAVSILGFDTGVLVLRSLFNMLPGGEKGVSNLTTQLLPLMLMGGLSGDSDGDSLKDILPILLMGQMGLGGMTPEAGANVMQPIMQMMMMKSLLGSGLGSGRTPSSGKFFDRSRSY